MDPNSAEGERWKADPRAGRQCYGTWKPQWTELGRKNARGESRLKQVGMLLDSEEARGQQRKGIPVWYNAEECLQKRYCPGQCVALRRLKGNRSKTQRKRKGKNKIDHKHTPKTGNPTLVDPRLRSRSGIEVPPRSTEREKNDPTQREKQKQNQDNEIRMKHANLLKRS